MLRDGHTLRGVVAELDGERAGALLHHADEHGLEVVFLAASIRGAGIGSMLLAAVPAIAREHGCRRAWLVTTNDNTNAIRFYQRQGWVLEALHHDALDESRRLKPSIPELGNDGIPMRHELEFSISVD